MRALQQKFPFSLYFNWIYKRLNVWRLISFLLALTINMLLISFATADGIDQIRYFNVSKQSNLFSQRQHSKLDWNPGNHTNCSVFYGCQQLAAEEWKNNQIQRSIPIYSKQQVLHLPQVGRKIRKSIEILMLTSRLSLNMICLLVPGSTSKEVVLMKEVSSWTIWE